MTAALAVAAPVVVPIDPEDLDATRPADLDVCSVCMGDGAIDLQVDGEWTAEPCWSCHGSRQRGAS